MMKQKRIVLIYVKGFIESVAYVEKAFNNIANELVSEGRIVKYITSNIIKFEDGTTVTKIPFDSEKLLGKRLTHLYIDENVFELKHGNKYINEALKPLVVGNGIYENFDTEGNPTDRIMTFGLSGFNKLKGEW